MSINVTEVVKEVKARVEANRKAIRERLTEGPPPPGLEPVDDDTFMAFIGAMIQQHPAEMIITPEGEPIMASPWIAMLPLVEGGSQLVDRMLKIQRKGGV